MDRKKGLIRTINKVQVKDRVFSVEQYQCSSCGTKHEFKDFEAKLCPKCGRPMKQKSYKDVTKSQVHDILSNKVVWKCPDCSKEYDKPTLCCNKKHQKKESKIIHLSDRQEQRIEGHKPYLGYMCDGCKTIYDSPIKCCQGFLLIQGMVYPEPTIEQLNKLNSLKVNAITGVVQ